jgi:hypothetical protein
MTMCIVLGDAVRVGDAAAPILGDGIDEIGDGQKVHRRRKSASSSAMPAPKPTNYKQKWAKIVDARRRQRCKSPTATRASLWAMHI